MDVRRHAPRIGLAALLVVVALGTAGAAAGPVAQASTASPALLAIADGGQFGPLAAHCGPNESRVDLGGGLHDCVYDPPRDGTCVELESMAVEIR